VSTAALPPRPPASRAATAARLRAPSWRDPRLVVGLLLVLTSVLLGARVVAAASSTTPVWAAARTLVPGEEVTAEDLRRVDVHVDGGTGAYLAAGAALPDGAVVLREVVAGDLVPRSALGASADLTTRPVGLPVSGPVPSGLVAGALVDVWVVPPTPTSTRAGWVSTGPDASGASRSAAPAAQTGPHQLTAGAVVAEVTTDSTAFSTGRGAVVQVELAPAELQQALQALADDASVSLVLVPGSTPTAAG